MSCKKCDKPTGPAFGLCSECVKLEDRKTYAFNEAQDAGLTAEQAFAVRDIAMTVNDDISDDDFETVVEHIIQGVANP